MDQGNLTYQKKGGPKWILRPYAKDKLLFDNASTIGEMGRNAEGNISRFAMQTLTGMAKNVIIRIRGNNQ
ncbi:MAG: hypothetical protein Q8940_20205 [Bacteroidota bacterium]|nr:hypothetical protein [Bacteroidota bacterium]